MNIITKHRLIYIINLLFYIQIWLKDHNLGSCSIIWLGCYFTMYVEQSRSYEMQLWPRFNSQRGTVNRNSIISFTLGSIEWDVSNILIFSEFLCDRQTFLWQIFLNTWNFCFMFTPYPANRVDWGRGRLQMIFSQFFTCLIFHNIAF